MRGGFRVQRLRFRGGFEGLGLEEEDQDQGFRYRTSRVSGLGFVELEASGLGVVVLLWF